MSCVRFEHKLRLDPSSVNKTNTQELQTRTGYMLLAHGHEPTPHFQESRLGF